LFFGENWKSCKKASWAWEKGAFPTRFDSKIYTYSRKSQSSSTVITISTIAHCSCNNRKPHYSYWKIIGNRTRKWWHKIVNLENGMVGVTTSKLYLDRKLWLAAFPRTAIISLPWEKPTNHKKVVIFMQ
jgi:hypothetical protein